MPPLLAFVSLNVAGRCFIGLALLLPFIGTNLLHAALFRQRSYWPLAAALVVYNELLFAGFLNYLIGLGLALIGAALWVWTIDRPAVRIVTGAGLAIIIFFCHLIALVCYGFLLLAIEVAYAIERRPSQGFVGRLDAARIAALIFPFVLPALLYLHAPLADASVAAHWGVLPKIEGVFAEEFMTYSYVLDGCAFLASDWSHPRMLVDAEAIRREGGVVCFCWLVRALRVRAIRREGNRIYRSTPAALGVLPAVCRDTANRTASLATHADFGRSYFDRGLAPRRCQPRVASPQ